MPVCSPAQPESPAQEQTVPAADSVGFWTGDRGQLALRDVVGAYGHDRDAVASTCGTPPAAEHAAGGVRDPANLCL